MFDHYYFPVGLEKELVKQLDTFQYQAQILVDGRVFLNLSNKIIKAQVVGKYFELIILLPRGYRTLENANLIHRVADAGAKVGILEISAFDTEIEQFAIFDSKLFYSDRQEATAEDLHQFFLKKYNDFESIMNSCKQVSSYADSPKISFSSNKYFVSKGERVTLSWDVKNAHSIFLNPGNKSVDPLGEETLIIEDDCLFTIISKNIKSKTSLSIFIRCLQKEDLRLEISVFNKEVGDYIKIDPTVENESIYAVYQNDLVRVEWICTSRSRLFEAKMGNLKNVGFRDFIVGEISDMNFELQGTEGVFKKTITLYPLPKKSSKQPLDSVRDVPFILQSNAPKRQSFIYAWAKKIITLLKSIS